MLSALIRSKRLDYDNIIPQKLVMAFVLIINYDKEKTVFRYFIHSTYEEILTGPISNHT